MILNHVSIGTKNVKAAIAFYDAVLSTLSIQRTYLIDNIAAAYGEQLEFWVGSPTEGQASVGNGSHIAFNAPSRKDVDAFYSVAIEQEDRVKVDPDCDLK